MWGHLGWRSWQARRSQTSWGVTDLLDPTLQCPPSPTRSRGLLLGQGCEHGPCSPTALHQLCEPHGGGVIPSSASPGRATTRGARPGTWPSETQHDTLCPQPKPPPPPPTAYMCSLTCPAASFQGRYHRAPNLEEEEERWVGGPIQARSQDASKRHKDCKSLDLFPPMMLQGRRSRPCGPAGPGQSGKGPWAGHHPRVTEPNLTSWDTGSKTTSAPREAGGQVERGQGARASCLCGGSSPDVPCPWHGQPA